MEFAQMLMNFVVAPLSFISLLFTVPLVLLFRLLSFIVRSFYIEDVTGKVVVITGASSGIGEYMAYEYAKRGARLVLAARREDRLKVVSDKAQRLGSPDVLVVCTDVSKVEHCRRLVDETIKHFGQLDHLVNNAGVADGFHFEGDSNTSDFSYIMDINFWGTVNLTKFATPHLKKSKGKIVAVASSAAWFPIPGMSIYSSSKGAVISFYEQLRTEFGSRIGITIVAPGFIDSEMSSTENLSRINMNFLPVASTKGCAEAIVTGARRGDRKVTQPSWVMVAFCYKVMCPEIVESICRYLMITKPKIIKDE